MHKPGYSRDYYRANRERILAKKKAWRDANVERCREVEAAWRKAHPETVAESRRRYRQKPESKAKDAAAQRQKRRANPKRAKDKDRLYRLRKKARMAADPKLYEHFMLVMPERYARERRRKRISYAKKMILAGRPYHPQPNRRVPDWCVKQGVVDVRSQWLAENLTPSQRDYAMRLAIERKEWRER